MKIHTEIRLVAMLVAALAMPARADDTRQRVELPAPMQAHMLANMRDHLHALETITRQLADAQYEAASETAENRLGMTAMQAHGAAHLAPFMPEPMRAIGAAMHHAASQFAITARDAAVTNDLGAAFGALSQVMRQCVACHEGFRVH
jgi:antitoxin component HigA of HigAB toxin-antitoxin module